MTIELPRKVGQPAHRVLDGVTRFTTRELLALHGMGHKAIRILGAALGERAMNFASQNNTTG